MHRRLFLLAGLIWVGGCSSADFDVAGDPSADTGTTDTANPAEDSGGTADGVAPDEGVPEVVAEAGCPALTNPTEIWVDGTSTASPATGSSSCPFRHVLEAVEYANKLGGNRAIKVRAGIYTESAAIVLRAGLTLTGSGVGITQLAGGGPCYETAGAYKCIVRVDGGATLERVSVDAGPTAKHGVVTGSSGGSYAIVRSTKITGAVGDGNAGILATSGAILGPNIESIGNRYGLVIWGNQPTTILEGTNKFDGNAAIGINHEGTGVLTFGGGSVSNNLVGIKLGEPYTATPPMHDIKDLTARGNIEIGIRVMAVASARIRNSTITGSKIGVMATHGASNFIDLGTTGSLGGNNFGGSSVKNSMAGVCALFTQGTPMNIAGNTFPDCSAPRSLGDIGSSAGCESITEYEDVWYRGASVPVTTGCTRGP